MSKSNQPALSTSGKSGVERDLQRKSNMQNIDDKQIDAAVTWAKKYMRLQTSDEHIMPNAQELENRRKLVEIVEGLRAKLAETPLESSRAA